ncbi:hypothetical protein GGR70_000580 [Xanthomonas campestris]|nr:hypothetical protein [Xanthomonas campestris]
MQNQIYSDSDSDSDSDSENHTSCKPAQIYPIGRFV